MAASTGDGAYNIWWDGLNVNGHVVRRGDPGLNSTDEISRNIAILVFHSYQFYSPQGTPISITFNLEVQHVDCDPDTIDSYVYPQNVTGF